MLARDPRRVARDRPVVQRADPGRVDERGPAALVRPPIADEGIFATLLGYDAIRTGESRGTRSDIWVILNRTALLVQDKDV